jgi:dTDP-4-dehydrorhamnose reductase
MICGNGLVAQTLFKYQEDKSILIFASGVSNSQERNEEAFIREKKMLLSNRSTSAKIVYFSSCSIFDSGSSENRYVMHKKEMEEIVASQFEKYLIVRLPLLISRAPNPYTFFNFIRKCIVDQDQIRVQKNAWRYLFDAEDLKFLIPIALEEINSNSRLNMAYDNATPVPMIINQFEEILRKNARFELVEEGTFYDFDRTDFYSLLSKHEIHIDPKQYNQRVLKKYLSEFNQSTGK